MKLQYPVYNIDNIAILFERLLIYRSNVFTHRMRRCGYEIKSSFFSIEKKWKSCSRVNSSNHRTPLLATLRRAVITRFSGCNGNCNGGINLFSVIVKVIMTPTYSSLGVRSNIECFSSHWSLSVCLWIESVPD